MPAAPAARAIDTLLVAGGAGARRAARRRGDRAGCAAPAPRARRVALGVHRRVRARGRRACSTAAARRRTGPGARRWRAATRRHGRPRPDLRPRRRRLDLGGRHRGHGPRARARRGRPRPRRRAARSRAGSCCSSSGPGGQSQFSAQLGGAGRRPRAAARAAGLDRRPPRRRPLGRRARRARVHEPARTSRASSAPRSADARRLRRGACASSARGGCSRRPAPSTPSPAPRGFGTAETLRRAFARRARRQPARLPRPLPPPRPDAHKETTDGHRHPALRRLHRARRRSAPTRCSRACRARRVRFVAERGRPDPRPTTACSQLVAEATLDDVPAPDVVVVPGGFGTRALATTSARSTGSARVDETSTWTTSVCTGSLLLGAAGLLDGLRGDDALARARRRSRSYGAEPDGRARGRSRARSSPPPACRRASTWRSRSRRTIAGDDVAQAIQLGIEYDPQPPFDSGSVAKAAPEAVQRIRAAVAARERASQERSAV